MELLVWLGILMIGALLSWVSQTHPATLPAWAPWDFSWLEFLAGAITLWWFVRGQIMSAISERQPLWRYACYLLGLALLYVVLETRFLYLSLHMFLFNRIQHLTMHHLAPFLIALGQPGPMIRRGMPAPVRRIVGSRTVNAALGVVQQPVVAAVLFVGLIVLWLIPPVHFAAMLDPRLYAIMNWSMVVDGLLFWSLVLDSRPQPPARLGYGTRIAMIVGVMFPQILLGATITFDNRVLYPYYDLCGRMYPAIGALLDQHLGGIVVWIPAAMMSVAGFFVALVNFRLHEEARERVRMSLARRRGPVVNAASWTGR
jgi:putative membrane protein